MAQPVFHVPASPEEAVRQQEALRGRVCLQPFTGEVSIVGAVDCSHAPGAAMGVVGIVLCHYPSVVELAHTVVEHPVTFPYLPGLLAFRELPLILAAIESLSQLPDVWLVDGHGIAHPRRLGIATHLGLLLDRPTIGCAKRGLVGHAAEPPQRAGAWTPLTYQGETVGCLLRTRAHVNPMVVSPGHRVDLAQARSIVQRCCDGQRIPKPLREADRLVRGLAGAAR